MNSGRVFDIQRFSLHDGPGIRTTVFLKGCPLRCRWCHNPEGLRAGPDILYQRSRCTACGACAAVCPQGAHRIVDGEHRYDRAACNGCGACSRACTGGALELSGQTMTVDAVMAVVERDRPFYEQSGGGLSISGGEPMMQAAFARALLHSARQAGLHTVVETSCACDWSALEGVLELTDRFLCDIKAIDEGQHRRLTGLGNGRILANIRRLLQHGAHVTLRMPLIPGCNASDEDLQRAMDFLRDCPQPAGVEALSYHALGGSKYERLDMALPQVDGEIPEQRLQHWRRALERAAG